MKKPNYANLFDFRIYSGYVLVLIAIIVLIFLKQNEKAFFALFVMTFGFLFLTIKANLGYFSKPYEIIFKKNHFELIFFRKKETISKIKDFDIQYIKDKLIINIELKDGNREYKYLLNYKKELIDYLKTELNKYRGK